jgi:hypothetical protein
MGDIPLKTHEGIAIPEWKCLTFWRRKSQGQLWLKEVFFEKGKGHPIFSFGK